METYEAEVQQLLKQLNQKEGIRRYEGGSSTLVERLRLAIVAGDLDEVKQCVAIAEKIGGKDGKYALMSAHDRESQIPVFTALKNKTDECFHYLLDNHAHTIRWTLSSKKDHGGNLTFASHYALELEIGQIIWDPVEHSLPDLVRQVGEKRYDGTPLKRLFEKDLWALSLTLAEDQIWNAKERICASEGDINHELIEAERDFKEVIALAILLRLKEEFKHKLDMECIEGMNRMRASLWSCLTDDDYTPINSRKKLICQAILIKNITGKFLDVAKQKHEFMMLNNCCFGCREMQPSIFHLWENKPCSHVLWCRSCKDWLMKMTEGLGYPHECIICSATVTSTVPSFPWLKILKILNDRQLYFGVR